MELKAILLISLKDYLSPVDPNINPKCPSETNKSDYQYQKLQKK